MTRKQILILVALVFFFALVAFGGFLAKNKTVSNPLGGSQSMPENIQKIFPSNATGTAANYTSQIPAGAAPTTPNQTIPITDLPEATPGAAFKIFHIEASSNGYSPSSITVKAGDTVEIDLTAIGSSFDLFSVSAGFYVSASPSSPGKISFLAGTSGTFLFECRDFCPASGKIQGALVVL